MTVLLDNLQISILQSHNSISTPTQLRANGNLRVEFLNLRFKVPSLSQRLLAFRLSVLKIRDMNPLSNGLFKDYEECTSYR